MDKRCLIGVEIVDIVINGNFMSSRITGIERYARELTSALDDLLKENDAVTLLVPANSKNVPKYKNIVVQQTASKGGIIWEQTTLRSYLKKHRDTICLNLCNVAPLFVQPGITAIHDIMCKVNKNDFTTLRNRMSRYWHVFQYWYIIKHEKKIITVSNFSKNEIEKRYPNSKGKISVIPNAWQHVLRYSENGNWQEKYPFLEDKQFFFSMATLSRNKNGKWIIEVAKRNPDCVFAMAGKDYETAEYTAIPENVYMLGYISDGDACALIKHCKAFLFPSLSEGFGLPPLEALSLGTQIIVSNQSALPEVFEKAAHYIDPYETNVDLDLLLVEQVDDAPTVLNKYSWSESAKILYDLMYS